MCLGLGGWGDTGPPPVPNRVEEPVDVDLYAMAVGCFSKNCKAEMVLGKRLSE